MSAYVVAEFANIRRSEIVVAPVSFEVHPDFQQDISKEELIRAFHAVHRLFHRLFNDIADNPAGFGLPTYTTDQRQGGPEYNDARIAADRPFHLLMYLFAHGTVKDSGFVVDVPGFRLANKGVRAVKNIDVPLKALADYGFIFGGLKDFKLPGNAPAFEISYPENPHVLTVLHLVAEKCYRFTDTNGFARFRTWNYKLLGEARGVMTVGTGGDHVADSLKNAADREFVLAFHDAATKNNLTCTTVWTHEGPHVRWFEGKNAYLFEAGKNKDHVTFRMRIRDAEACMDYLKGCPEGVKEMFRQTNNGCEKRQNNTCVASTRNTYEGEEKWRCGCWGAPFYAPPEVTNILYYLKLVELGKKKPRRAVANR